MKRMFAGLLLALGLAMAGNAQTQPAVKKTGSLKRHALAKVLMAPVKVAAVAPKAAAKGIAYTLGGVLFAAESGVDVVHLATDVLDKGVGAEGWKKNPFHYPNKIVGYADTGLEDAYSFFFHVQI